MVREYFYKPFIFAELTLRQTKIQDYNNSFFKRNALNPIGHGSKYNELLSVGNIGRISFLFQASLYHLSSVLV